MRALLGTSRHVSLRYTSLSAFKQLRRIDDDTHNNIPGGQLKIQYLCRATMKEVAFLSIRPQIGQINILVINNPADRGRGLGALLVNDAQHEMKRAGAKNAWAVCYNSPPAFWKSLGFETRTPAHESVTGRGYSKNLPSFR